MRPGRPTDARIQRGPQRARAAFTLIELIAVVALLGMMLFVVVPRLDLADDARLRAEARALGGRIEFARQRAIFTGRPHRVLMELGEGWYQVEWFVSDRDVSPESAPVPVDPRGPIPMSPPESEQRHYRAIPGAPGDVVWLPEETRFAGVEVAEGWLSSGPVQIVFDEDGATDAADVYVQQADDATHRKVLRVGPLLDQVEIRDDAG